MNPSDSVVSLTAIHTNKLVVLTSIKTFEIFLRSHLLSISKSAGSVVEMVMDPMSGVVLGLTGQAHPLILLFPIKLLIIPPTKQINVLLGSR